MQAVMCCCIPAACPAIWGALASSRACGQGGGCWERQADRTYPQFQVHSLGTQLYVAA